ncbi:hypothetical protein CRM22_009673 [Opisthorchis felineus]|uniref:Peptidase S1 domain-containing protein n=1 Tax=Opisthorchis felineus TaxID=147828 RepID=A0A4S2L5U2_OPIFE|nr:hypothetical protein CRM22_009673 [Opisthorchis felineus]
MGRCRSVFMLSSASRSDYKYVELGEDKASVTKTAQMKLSSVNHVFLFIAFARLLFCECQVEQDSRCYDTSALSAKSGVVYSHARYGTEKYPSELHCIYEIRGTANSEFKVDIVDMDIEESGQCLFDYMSIGAYESDDPYYLCGKEKPSFPILIPSSSLLITFASDAANGGKGFNLTYEAIEKEPLDTTQCGVAPKQKTVSKIARLIGGMPVTLGQWPWVVSLWDSGEFKCGASVLNKNWLLTAAHCFVKDFTPSTWHAVVGDLLLDRFDAQEQRVDVKQIHIHPGYRSRGRYDNDIALIELKSPIIYGRTAIPICLESPDSQTSVEADALEANSNVTCYIAGWGRSETQAVSNELRQLKLSFLNLAQCNETEAYKGKLTSSMLCAGYMSGGKDSCKGDSGGPLMCQEEKSGRWFQLGIVSFGKQCAAPGTPGLYSRVSVFLDWIKSLVELEKP